MANIGTKWMKSAGFTASTGFAAMLALSVAAQAGEQPDKGRYVNLKADAECSKIPDVEGHVICSFEMPGVSIVGNGEMDARVARGTLDYINGVGTAQGYTVTTSADGSTLTVQWEGTSKFDDQKVRHVEGTYTCVAGSGRFSGATCKGTWKQADQKGGFALGEWDGTITLPD